MREEKHLNTHNTIQASACGDWLVKDPSISSRVRVKWENPGDANNSVLSGVVVNSLVISNMHVS